MVAEEVIATVDTPVAARRATGGWGAASRWSLIPGLVLLVVGYFLPLATVVPQLWAGGGASLGQAFSPVYLRVAENTFLISVITTAVTLVVAYPLAWMISRAGSARKLLLILLVLVPFLTSVLVRTFSWVVLLGRDGLVNSALEALGIIHSPLRMLFTTGAVVVALVHVTIPLMVFSLVTVMQRIDTRVRLVAESLGASPAPAFLRIILPLTVPGIRSGAVLVFLYSMASFIAPAVLGGTGQTMLAQVIQSQIESGYNWSLAASLGLVLAIIAIVAVALIGVLARWATPYLRARLTTPIGPDRTGEDLGVLREQLSTAHRAPNSLRRVLRVAGRWAARAYLPVLAVFLLLPLVVLVPVSLSSDKTIVFPPRGFSLRWFETVFTDPKWMEAAATSLRIGVIVALAATVLAVLIVLGIGRHRSTITGFIESLIMAPLSIPAVVFALGAYLAYSQLFRLTGRALRLTDSELGIIIAHTALVLPFAFLLVTAAYVGVDERLERAAASLGSRPRSILLRVTLPLMAPGLLASVVLCFLQSFDESVVSLFLSGLRVSTLPRLLWNGVRFGTTPAVAVVSVLLLLITCLAVAVIGLLLWWRQTQLRRAPS